jgi:hypothetical protein
VDEGPRSPPPRSVAGWIVTGAGIVVVLYAVILLTSAGYGTRVLHDFAERRSYDMVKRDVHRAFPRALLTAVCGGVLVWVGGRLRERR